MQESAIVAPSTARSAQVRQILENYRQSLATMHFDLGELLIEAVDNNYIAEWGITLDVLCETNFDISEREAFYRMNVVRKSRDMGYARAEIEHIAFSKLKQIFRLDPDGVFFNPDTGENEKLEAHIRRLIDIADATGLKAIAAEVKRLKGQTGENELTWENYQTTRAAKENVIVPGKEAFRRYLGSKNVQEKEGSSEYSDGFIYEMIFAEILAGAEAPSEEIADEAEEEGEDA